MEEIQKHLFELQDMAYRDFHSRLMPDTDKETVIGIRVPVLRKYAKSIAGTELSEKFIKELPHHYYEENNLHMMLITRIKRWIASSETYTIRYGIGMLMRLYLDEDFEPEYVKLVAGVESDEYYVNMMIAWYMATALAKQWDAVIPYIEEHRLSDGDHRKTIQKAVESYRITDEQKKYLKGYR